MDKIERVLELHANYLNLIYEVLSDTELSDSEKLGVIEVGRGTLYEEIKRVLEE